jgi:hypothetical protein
VTGGALDRVIADLERAPRVSWQEAQRQWRSLFERGHPPSQPLDGDYAGRLLLVTVRGPLGAITRAWTRAWMPWKGKRFHAEAGLGDNRFTASARPLLRLYWPFYRLVRRAEPGHIRAFTFATRLAPSVVDPARTVLRIDYDLDENPRFWIRDVVDELVEVAPGEYLGEAQARLAGRWRTAAYFALVPVRLPSSSA